MEQHIRIVAILQIVMGALAALLGLILFAVIFGAGAISGDRTAMLVTGTIGTVLAGILILLAIPSIVAGIGLQRRRNWARILTIVLSVLHLFNIPLGTVIGGYSLWVLLNEQAPAYFTPAGRA